MKKLSYLEWLSAEELHKNSMIWLSELKFIKDEQRFLNNLIQSFTTQFADAAIYEESKTTIANLQHIEKDSVPLFKRVQTHENQLKIMVDNVDQLKMEKAYIETHEELQIAMDDYSKNYRGIKERLFKLLTFILKKEKQKRQLN